MRKRRELLTGAYYHVGARVNRKEMIFHSSGTKELFLDVVERAKGRFDFRLDNFCIMGNHYHFIIQPGNTENLSKIMQWIMSVFAISYNKLHKLTGHVWGDRFFSHILSNIREYLRAFDYIDNNPVKAGLVKEKSSWIFGGLYHRCQGRWDIIDPPPLWLMMMSSINNSYQIENK